MNMRDISHKPRTLRIAVATARLRCDAATVGRLKSGDLPKGDPLPVARVAAIQAAKNTSQLLPYCHPLPIDYVGVDFVVGDDRIDITVEVKAIHRTGVEMEALTAASIAALTIYDLLKAIQPKTMSIEGIALISKKGGKSQVQAPDGVSISAGILVFSDSVSAGTKIDGSGILIQQRLEALGVTVAHQETIPDQADRITSVLKNWCDDLGLNLIITTGGTGVGPRDVTPETVTELLDRNLPGVEEALRAHGQERTPYAMLSRGVAGQRGNTVLVTLPGSPKGVVESLDAILPALLHVIPMMQGGEHER